MQEFVEKTIERIYSKQYVVGIVGLGYVGLPLLWTFHEAGFVVRGFDIDQSKISCLKNGIPYIKHLGSEMMQRLSNSPRCEATIDFGEIVSVDAILLCVPTPLNRNREPDMRFVESTLDSIGQFLQPKQLVVLESTTYPGTTGEVLIPRLEDASDLKAGQDFLVAYSPERKDPGNSNFRTRTIPKVTGGSGQDSRDLATALY
jgi:UDP-N-acetyl-D-glucosamine dehydrogenase